MAYKRDWLEVNPINHTKFSAQPGNVRAHKVDISDRLKGMFKGFVTGETQTDEGVISLPFNVQSSNPGASANKVKTYAKDVSSKAEFHIQDEDADVVQVTAGGNLNAAALGGVYGVDNLAAVVAILEHVYPVGSVVAFGVSTNPATLLGVGTWTAIEGKVIVGISGSDAEFDTLDETGGSKTHTLTEAQMPAHTHTFSRYPTTAVSGSQAGSSSLHQHDTGTTGSKGSGGSHNNLQPYIVKYCWQRVS